jgi:hypothetical protein
LINRVTKRVIGVIDEESLKSFDVKR